MLRPAYLGEELLSLRAQMTLFRIRQDAGLIRGGGKCLYKRAARTGSRRQHSLGGSHRGVSFSPGLSLLHLPFALGAKVVASSLKILLGPIQTGEDAVGKARLSRGGRSWWESLPFSVGLSGEKLGEEELHGGKIAIRRDVGTQPLGELADGSWHGESRVGGLSKAGQGGGGEKSTGRRRGGLLHNRLGV